MEFQEFDREAGKRFRVFRIGEGENVSEEDGQGDGVSLIA